MTLSFFFDVVCPFAYIASQRVRALAVEADLKLEWVPILLGGVLRDVGSPQRPMDAMNASKAQLTILDAARQADLHGVELHYTEAHPRRSVEAMRVLAAANSAQRPALMDVLFRAYWVDDLDISDLDVLQRLCAPYGIDARAVNRDVKVRQQLFDNTTRAVSLGAFGVPWFQLGDRGWWGGDRIHLVRAALGLPPEVAQYSGQSSGKIVTFYHDFSSPFSYLASTQIERIAAETGAELERVPFLLGALFKSIGTPLIPIQTFPKARRDYQGTDLDDWSTWWQVPFQFSTNFPFRTVTALRVAIAEPKCTDAIYKAGWANDRDLSSPDVLRCVLDEAGFDGQALLEQTQDPAIKQQLFANTQRAQAAGACGAPTCVVDDTHVFWGQDRLGQVESALRGWQPPWPNHSLVVQ
ncbi:MAG: hypothetical protein GWP91_02575 [Rhodobacterales bacterium]|nr:hypothetical protein [Rhodobacterales bacterium]